MDATFAVKNEICFFCNMDMIALLKSYGKHTQWMERFMGHSWTKKSMVYEREGLIRLKPAFGNRQSVTHPAHINISDIISRLLKYFGREDDFYVFSGYTLCAGSITLLLFADAHCTCKFTITICYLQPLHYCFTVPAIMSSAFTSSSLVLRYQFGQSFIFGVVNSNCIT